MAEHDTFGGIAKSFKGHNASFLDFAAHVLVKRVIERSTAQLPTGGAPRLGMALPLPDLKALAHEGKAEIHKIGIIGAGVSGLYAAMILEDLGIPYEILEANERVGGRIYTYRFNGEAGKDAPVNDPARYDYFDVGAMRYPRIPFMDRVFDLFTRININDLLVEYKLSADNTLQYYNTQPPLGGPNTSAEEDYFQVSLTNNGTVPDSYVAQSVGHWTGSVYDYYKDLFAELDTVPPEERTEVFERAWTELTKQDHFSTRGYMLAGPAGKPESAPPPYPESVVQWLETFDSATGLYDHAFVASVMDSLDFDWPNPQRIAKPLPQSTSSKSRKELPGKDEWDWVCIDGGSDRMIDGMLDKVTQKPKTSKYVAKIYESKGNRIAVECGLTEGTKETFEYSQVICTAPLGCIAAIDLDGCDLLYNQKLAIRSLQYDASTKVGIKFETRWWEDPQFMNGYPIVGGASNTDIPIRVCVYPSYGRGCPPETPPPGVLLASYAWAQDARRLSSLIQGHNTDPERLLLDLTMDNISKLHGIPRDKLPTPVDYFAHSWYTDQYSRGAFALFGPGQFGSASEQQSTPSMFTSIKAPAAKGKLHFAGEATSVHHAWVLGSLNSAWRAVYNALNGHQELQDQLIARWGIPDEETEVSLKKLTLLARYKAL